MKVYYMTTDEFKLYQRQLNKQRINKLAEGPLPQNKPLLEPKINFGISTDLNELTIDNLPINIQEPVKEPIKEQPVKNNSVTLF